MTDLPPPGDTPPQATTGTTGPPPPSVPGVHDLVEIGRGGFGVVYRGHQPDLDRDVAVKVLPAPGVDERAVERWRREVTAMGRLSNHPNIVGVFSAGVTGEGHPYLVMPYAPGGSLHDRVQAHGPLSPAEAARLGAGLANGLAAAHDAGVLHRDVKPANVLLSEYGEPQLSDFGIARLADAATTTTTSVQATVGYAAPEILSGEPATPASDVYGLGATLHAALAAQAPFAGPPEESLMARIGRVVTQPPPDLRAQGVPSALAEVVERCLAKEPAGRPASAGEVRQALEALDLSGAAAAAPAAGPTATEVLQPIPVVPDGAAAPPGDELPPPEEGDGDGPSRGAWVALGVAVLVLFLVAGLAGWTLTRSGGEGATTGDTTEPTTTTEPAPPTDPPEEPPATDPPASPPEREPSPTISVPTPPPTPSTEPPEEPDPPPGTAEDYVDLVQRYYALVADGDLEASYALLSPTFRQGQSFEDYEEFWTEDVDGVAIAGQPVADVEAGTVDLTLRFALDGGESVEDVRVGIVAGEDGGLLIDSYEVLRRR